MQAIFIAYGTFSRSVKTLNTSEPANRSPIVIDGFENVEIKGLIAKIFGIDLVETSHNGTTGFWDNYF